MSQPVTPRRRILLAAAALVIVLAGVGARALLTGLPAKVLGVALWAALVYALVLWIVPAVSVQVATWTAMAISFAVEIAQLTPGPAWLSSKSMLLRMIFGTTFSIWDLPMYAGGILMIASVDRAWASRRRQAGRD